MGDVGDVALDRGSDPVGEESAVRGRGGEVKPPLCREATDLVGETA